MLSKTLLLAIPDTIGDGGPGSVTLGWIRVMTKSVNFERLKEFNSLNHCSALLHKCSAETETYLIHVAMRALPLCCNRTYVVLEVDRTDN